MVACATYANGFAFPERYAHHRRKIAYPLDTALQRLRYLDGRCTVGRHLAYRLPVKFVACLSHIIPPRTKSIAVLPCQSPNTRQQNSPHPAT
jgi:hypothetical protein